MAMRPMPFAEAMAWARARQVVLPEVYYGQLQGLARAQAFTIAGLTSLDQLQAVHDSLTRVLETGETFAAWKARVLNGEIPLVAGAAQIETVFRNAIQQAYNRGRHEQQARTVASHPYYLYDAVNDNRTRPTHAAMDGVVARHDDPLWTRWTPACGHRCRCKRIALTEVQARRYQDEDATRLADADRAAARRDALLQGPDPGWGHDPYREPNRGLRQAIDQRLARCQEGATLSVTLARRRGGCLAQAERILMELRSRLDGAVTTTSRDRFEANIGAAAQLAAAADRFVTLWRSERHYQAHLVKRMERGEVRDATDYRRAILRALDEAELILVATAPGEPDQIAIESAAWAIIYSQDVLVTAYPKLEKAESFIAQQARLSWTLGEVIIDDAARATLDELRAGIARLGR